MELSDFEFSLPDELIAQHPLLRRDDSRMMVVRRECGTWEHRTFRELPEILDERDFLVVNSSRVFPARLRACRPGRSEEIEVFLLRESAPGEWEALTRPGKKAPVGQRLDVAGLKAQVTAIHEDGRRSLRFEDSGAVAETAERLGRPPLPPYIRRQGGEFLEEDRERYQTVYARHSGSIAAPTAGLHFTPEILRELDAKGIPRCEIVLHAGYGTFQPIRTEQVEIHRMEPEYYEVSAEAAACIGRLKTEGRRLVSVGTTTTRVLEHLALRADSIVLPGSGWCDLFIYPGFPFRMVGGLLTNFHLPASTLLMLVCAFAGKDLIFQCYQDAVFRRYRFYSYGDCMLIL